MEFVKIRTKEIVHKSCTSVHYVVSHRVQVNDSDRCAYILKLNNYVNGWRAVGASFLIIGAKSKVSEESRLK